MLVVSVAASWAQPARLEQRNFPSTLGSQSFYLYLPPGYDSTAERYPVVMLLRGVETEWITPTQDAARRGSIMTVADSLWQSGALPPVILVMPRISSPPTWPDMAYLADELIPWIDAHYRTLPTRWHRSVDGFSYGGLGSAMLITQAPERFVSAGGYDGSLFLYDPAWLQLWRQDRRLLYAAMQFLYTTTGPGQTGNQRTVGAFVDTLAAYGIENGYTTLNLTPDAQHNWYFADLHASRTLPRHGARMLAAPQRLAVSALLPPADTTVSGTVPITWHVPDAPASLRVFVHVSRDHGLRWYSLAESRAPDSTISWNTTALPDGTRYQVRVIAVGDTNYRVLRTTGTFRVDNPGNGAPDISLLSPVDEHVSGTTLIRWRADDPESDPLLVDVFWSSDDGATWATLATGRAAIDSLLWMTTEHGNGTRYRLRATASDGSATSSVTSQRLSLANAHLAMPIILSRISGHGDLEMRAYFVHDDPNLAAPFRLQVQRSPAGMFYTIRSAVTDSLLVTSTRIGGPEDEGPLFQGKRLALTVVDTPSVWPDSTRWVVGHSNLTGTVSLPAVMVDGTMLNGQPVAEDYEITVTDQPSDTSLAALGVDAQPVRFSVRIIGTDVKPAFIFVDADLSGGLSHADELYFVPSGSMLPVQLSWAVQFTSPVQTVPPQTGDVFRIRIRKPPQDGSIYEASVTLSSAHATAEIPTDIALDPAYPNPFNAATQVRFRTDHRTRVLVTVVDLLGRRVATLVDGVLPAGHHGAVWLADRAASGVYLIRLQAAGATATRKIVLTK